MRKNTQEITKPDTKNNDLGTPFGTHVLPICCQCDVFLRPGARNLPVGGPRCDFCGIWGWIWVPFWWHFGTYVDQLWPNASTQVRIHPVWQKLPTDTQAHESTSGVAGGANRYELGGVENLAQDIFSLRPTFPLNLLN